MPKKNALGETGGVGSAQLWRRLQDLGSEAKQRIDQMLTPLFLHLPFPTPYSQEESKEPVA